MNLKFSVFKSLLIYIVLFKCLCSLTRAENSTSPNKKIANAPNGPVGLDNYIKLNIGNTHSIKNIEEVENKNNLESEIDADFLKLKNAINNSNIPQGEFENTLEQYEINYNFPAWLTEMIQLSNTSKNTLESLGVKDLPDINQCSKIKNMKEQMLCIIEALDEIKNTYEIAKEITSLTARILAGGRMATRALIRMKTLASIHKNKQLINALGTPMVTLILIQRETTSDRDRWIAGSILTLLTDLPVVSDLADISTGSFGHVNVIMPRQSRVREADRIILRIREGSSPSSIISGFATADAEYPM